jgi:hypothetical protein
MNVHVHVTATWKRMRKAAPLPQVECTQQDSLHWRAGWWQGIAVGFVIGLGAAVVVLA